MNNNINYCNKGGFALCTDGSVAMVINGQNFILTRGCAFLVTPLVQISDFRPSSDYREVSFIDDLKLFYPIFRLIADTRIPLNVSRHPCWQLSDATIAFVESQNALMHSVQQRIAQTITQEEARLLDHRLLLLRRETMLEVVCDHLRCHPAGEGAASRQESVTYRFILSLHDKFHRERSVSFYASEAKLSAGHFTTIVRNATGRTPSQWIAAVTTAYAKMLLESSDKSVKEIAQELNFPEQFTFRKYFKQHSGFSPKEYRHRYVK